MRFDRYTGATILLFSFGYKINRQGKDELLAEAFHGMDNFAHAAMPGAFLVDLIPARKSSGFTLCCLALRIVTHSPLGPIVASWCRVEAYFV